MQCQGEHRVGDCIFYCLLSMGHRGEHRDMAGRRWRKMFVANVSPGYRKRGKAKRPAIAA